jgi:hypothetical protein
LLHSVQEASIGPDVSLLPQRQINSSTDASSTAFPLPRQAS